MGGGEVIEEIWVWLATKLGCDWLPRHLIKAKLSARSPYKAPLLKKRHVQNRSKFAKEHIDWSKRNDESKIVHFGSSGRQYIRRPPGTELKPQYTVDSEAWSINHGVGMFSYCCVGPIYPIPGTMHQFQCIKILEELLPYAQEEMPRKWMFQQDNDPKHASKRATSWFQKKRVEVSEWPAQSPDLNPIENLWSDIKNAVSEAKPIHSQELWDVVCSSWAFKVPEVGWLDATQMSCSYQKQWCCN